jgi:acyl-CoA reductase-like NAD-dependent aldehyde dehydrogenase
MFNFTYFNFVDAGRLVLGGELDRKERWMSPTIYVDVQDGDALMEDELFGPILPILRVDSPEQAIKLVLSRPKPLAWYVFSKSDEVINKFLDRTSCGGVCVNDTLWHNGCKCSTNWATFKC